MVVRVSGGGYVGGVAGREGKWGVVGREGKWGR